MIFRGSETLRGCLENDPRVNLTTLDLLPEAETGYEQSLEKARGRWIHNYNILSLYHREAANNIAAHSPKRIFTLGGDCGVEITPIHYLKAIYGEELAVIWLDAHADLNTPSTSPSKTFHGMALRALLETFEGTNQGPCEPEVKFIPDFVTSTASSHLQPEQVFLAGVRDLDPAEHEYIARRDITVVECEELELNQGKLLVDLLRRGGFSKVYIHVDADVLSLEESSSVMCPTEGGIQIQTLKRVIKDIKEADGVCVVGGSLVEVTKTNDDNGQYTDMATVLTSLWLE
jgi:arginase